MIVLPLAAMAAVWLGFFPISADVAPPAVEQWAARWGLATASSPAAKDLHNPLPPTEDNLMVGMRLYGRQCVVCHGAADGQPSRFAQGFYIKSPQFATDGVERDDEAVTYWKIENGIRFTAMPAFRDVIPSEDAWKVALFLKRMDRLPPAVDSAWLLLPSAGSSVGER